MGKQQVIVDTNALLMPFEFKINLDLELKRLIGDCEIIVPSTVLYELQRLKSRHAKSALQLAKKYKTMHTNLRGDKSILELAKNLRCPVITNDKNLIKKLQCANIDVIFLREKTHLVRNFF